MCFDVAGYLTCSIVLNSCLKIYMFWCVLLLLCNIPALTCSCVMLLLGNIPAQMCFTLAGYHICSDVLCALLLHVNKPVQMYFVHAGWYTF